MFSLMAALFKYENHVIFHVYEETKDMSLVWV